MNTPSNDDDEAELQRTEVYTGEGGRKEWL